MTHRVFRTPEAQLALPVDVEIVPTPAMRIGDSRVDQCSWYGLLVCADAGVKLGACPGCGCGRWWRQDCAPFDRAHWSGPFYQPLPGHITHAHGTLPVTTAIAVYTSEGCVGRCDVKCHNATSPECDCICGGRLHGTGAKAIQLQTDWIDPDGELRRRFAELHGHDPDGLRLEFGQQALFPATSPTAERDTGASTERTQKLRGGPAPRVLATASRATAITLPGAAQRCLAPAGTTHAHSPIRAHGLRDRTMRR